MTAITAAIPLAMRWGQNQTVPRAATLGAANRANGIASVAAWQRDVLDRLVGFGQLAPGWDGHQAPTVTGAAIVALANVLLNLPVDVHPAIVMPTAEGGAQLEWHRAGWDVEVQADPDGLLDLWIGHNDEDVEADLVGGSLVDALKRLTSDG